MKHLQRYVNEFVTRRNVQEMDMLDQMAQVATGMVGQRLKYWEPTA